MEFGLLDGWIGVLALHLDGLLLKQVIFAFEVQVVGIAEFARKISLITSWFVLALAFLRTGEDFIIGYNVIRRNFLLYIPSVKERMDTMESAPQKRRPENLTPQHLDETGFIQLPQTGVRVTKKIFEDYVTSRRLCLDPNVKMTDLVEPLATSRTTLSNFINKTYGMNFNRYINSLRLAELNRLLALPSNAGKTADDLFHKAGFASKRNYTRAKEAAEK